MVKVAETRGFEPPRGFRAPTSLAVRRTRPGYATSPSGDLSLQGLVGLYSPEVEEKLECNHDSSAQDWLL